MAIDRFLVPRRFGGGQVDALSSGPTLFKKTGCSEPSLFRKGRGVENIS